MNQHTIDTLQLLATMVRELEHGERYERFTEATSEEPQIVSRDAVLELIESLMRKELS